MRIPYPEIPPGVPLGISSRLLSEMCRGILSGIPEGVTSEIFPRFISGIDPGSPSEIPKYLGNLCRDSLRLPSGILPKFILESAKIFLTETLQKLISEFLHDFL